MNNYCCNKTEMAMVTLLSSCSNIISFFFTLILCIWQEEDSEIDFISSVVTHDSFLRSSYSNKQEIHNSQRAFK